MTAEQQEEFLSAAYKKAGLGSHPHPDRQLTNVEHIMEPWREGREMPATRSFVNCDELDMCFAYTVDGKPIATYAGNLCANCPIIKEGKLDRAFRKADIVLCAMNRLAGEDQMFNPAIG